MAGNANYDALLSTTLNNYRDTLEDNVSSQVALWWWLKQAGQVRKESGGAKIVVQLLYGKNSTSASYSKYDTFSTDPQEGITAAEFDWRNHGVTVAISGEEEDKNAGPEKVIDLLQAKIKQAQITCAEDFDEMFLGDGTGNSNKDFLGLEALIGNEASSVTTVGGIDCTAAANAFWRSVVDSTAEVLDVGTLAHLYNQMTRGPVQPNFAVTTMALYEKYESLLQNALRYTDTKMASAGFQNLMYKKAPVVFDSNIGAGKWYFLNSEYLELVQHSNTWLRNTPFQTPYNQDARYSKIISRGNLVISNRKLGGGLLSGKTAS